MSINQLFFDLDGTLVDSLPGITFSANFALSKVLPGRNPPDLLAFIGPPIREVFHRALLEDNPLILDSLEQAFRASYDTDGWKRTRIYSGVKSVLSKTREMGLVSRVLTNKPRRATLTILQNLGLASFFEEIITPDLRSPAYASKIEAALDARQRHSVESDKALLVGDSVDDGAAAAACGFKFAAAMFGYGRVFANCDSPIHFRLERFEDLLTIL